MDAITYAEETGTLTADDGAVFNVTIKKIDGLTTEEATAIFNTGEETGRWNWKEKIWHNLTFTQAQTVQAAARFFYGWLDNGANEKIGLEPDGKTFWFTAWYAC